MIKEFKVKLELLEESQVICPKCKCYPSLSSSPGLKICLFFYLYILKRVCHETESNFLVHGQIAQMNLCPAGIFHFSVPSSCKVLHPVFHLYLKLQKLLFPRASDDNTICFVFIPLPLCGPLIPSTYTFLLAGRFLVKLYHYFRFTDSV